MMTPSRTADARGRRWKPSVHQYRVLEAVRRYNDFRKPHPYDCDRDLYPNGWTIYPTRFDRRYLMGIFRMIEVGLLTVDTFEGMRITDLGREVLGAYIEKRGPDALRVNRQTPRLPAEPGAPTADEIAADQVRDNTLEQPPPQ